MSAFRRGGGWVAKFQHRAEQVWVPGGPWHTKSAAQEAERRHRERIAARADRRDLRELRGALACASGRDRRPRPAGCTRQAGRALLPQDFGADAARRMWSASRRGPGRSACPRNISRIIGNPLRGRAQRWAGRDRTRSPTSACRRLERTRGCCHAPTLDEYRRPCWTAAPCFGGYAAEFRAMIQFTAWTGVRAGELQALRWEDVGDRGRCRIRRSRKPDGALRTARRTARSVRSRYLEPARVLDQVPRRDRRLRLSFAARRAASRVEPLLPLALRSCCLRASLDRELCGRPANVRWHDLRHFCATQLLELGLDHFAVSRPARPRGRRSAGHGPRRTPVEEGRTGAATRAVEWGRGGER